MRTKLDKTTYTAPNGFSVDLLSLHQNEYIVKRPVTPDTVKNSMSGLIKSVKKERMQYETLSSFIRAECRRTASPDTLRFSRTDEWTTPKPLPLSPNARRKKGTESSHSMSGTTREYLTSIGGSVMSQST
mmetsp:Transcript_39427/g.101073  ORF Transcript_39427/g.101073 Transcript_39427/m.101073 type:complete len:130 (+) Transcript_39427:653-1042(+)